jgi:hypothetical protein
MYKLSYKLSVRERVSGKCLRHPGYNPEKAGRAGIKGGCSACYSLYDLHSARLALDAAVHEFTRRAGPWARPRERKRRKQGDTSTPDATIESVQP